MVTGTKLTYQDYVNTPDDERYELINGELILVPAPNISHQRSHRKLGVLITVFVDRHELGEVFLAPTDVVLSNTETEVVQPDVLFISKEREHIITEANIQGAPDLIVEILSPSTAKRDWQTKRDLYARHGVKEYWLADPATKIVWVMLLRDGALEIVDTYASGDTLESPTLEGFNVAVDDLFPRVSTDLT